MLNVVEDLKPPDFSNGKASEPQEATLDGTTNLTTVCNKSRGFAGWWMVSALGWGWPDTFVHKFPGWKVEVGEGEAGQILS